VCGGGSNTNNGKEIEQGYAAILKLLC